MQDNAPDDWDWDDEQPSDGRPSRRHLLIAAAVVPWLVVAAVVVAPSDRSDAARPEAARAAASAPDDLDPRETREGQPTTPAASAPTAARQPAPALTPTGPAVATTTRAAEAIAIVVAREWLTGAGAPLGLGLQGPTTDRYAEHLAVETVDFPAPGAVVVTVLAVVLDVSADPPSAGLERVAVPLTLDGIGAHVAGEPWSVPVPDLTLDPPTAQEEVTEPDILVEAGAALAAAGFGDVEVLSLHRTDSWPWIVRFRRPDPQGGAARERSVWLRPHLTGLVVAGTRPEQKVG